MGRIQDIAQRDIKRITSDVNGWAKSLTLIAPTGETVTITGLHTKHHLGVDALKQKLINTKNAHCSFSEDSLYGLNYPLRVVNDQHPYPGIVALENHRVRVTDSTGNIAEYKVIENFPDETIGLITCILADWVPDDGNP